LSQKFGGRVGLNIGLNSRNFTANPHRLAGANFLHNFFITPNYDYERNRQNS